jgi:predicted RNA-binding Zn ribbon-like protein
MKCKRCGKENVDPVYPHTCTLPSALALAEKIERANAGVYSQALYEEYTASARELRRLHYENEALQQALRTEEAISFRRQLHEVQAENEVLREALLHISTTVNMHSQELHIARAALAFRGEKI